MNAVSVMKILLFYGRFYHMMKSTMNMVKGVGIGMLAGAAVTVVGSQMMKTDKKHLKERRQGHEDRQRRAGQRPVYVQVNCRGNHSRAA